MPKMNGKLGSCQLPGNRQPEITRAQFAYLAIYLVLIGNVAAGEAPTERLFRGSDEGLYNLQFGKMRLPDNERLSLSTLNRYAQQTTASCSDPRT